MADDDSSQGGSDGDEDENFKFDQPYIPKQWENQQIEFTQSTIKEIENHKIKNSRPLIKVKFIKKRRQFGQQHQLTETDASEKMTDVKAQQDPFNHQKNQVLEIGLQGSNQLCNSSAQTTWNRRINKIHGMGTGVQEEMKEAGYEDDDSDILKFLEKCQLQVQRGLQSNEVVDIYQNDFAMLNEKDSNEAQPSGDNTELSSAPKESQNYFTSNTRGQKISSIQFQPNLGVQRGRYIAASCIQYLDSNDRIIYNMKSHKHQIVLWDFEDAHSYEPSLILVCPIQIVNFKFNPKDPNIIVAGGMNGQIFYWDLKVAFSTINAKQGNKAKQQKSDNYIPEIPHYISSALQEPAGMSMPSNSDLVKKNIPSHKNPVLSIAWLPPGVEILKNKFQANSAAQPEECNQFASIACDGQVLIWDIRFFDPKDARKQQQQDITTVIWKAIFGIQLFRPEGGGPMGGAQMVFPRINAKSLAFTATSDEGEVFLVDLLPQPNQNDVKGEMVTKIWNRQRNFRPTVALDLSPHFEDIVLTVHDFYFCIWKHDVDVPIFESSIQQGCQLMSGVFSPSRAAVIFIGKSDGRLEIWDFIDQSHKFTIFYQASAGGLSTIKFHENPAHHHTVAIGDIDGYVRIIELPYTLYKQSNEEKQIMREFWKRQVLRVEYFNKRFEIREQAYKQEKQAQEHHQALEEIKNAQKENEDKQDLEEDQIAEDEYRLSVDEFIKQYINKEPPKEKEKQKDDKQK